MMQPMERPGAMRALLATAMLLAAVVVLASATPAPAQSGNSFGQSYLTPFPENDVYRVIVLGDAFGEGINGGLAEALSDESGIEVIDRSNGATGLARNDETTWDKQLEQMAASEQIHAAVVLFGVVDRQSMRIEKRRYQVGSPEWKQEYGKRVDRVMKVLKREGAAIYWLGLPVMRSPSAAADAEVMNAIFREMAVINAVKFIDTWSGFTDASGGYSPYGPDLSGKVRELRSGDGVYFTGRGYQKLAHFAEQEIRRDLALARAERDVPLAGSEDEQARIAAERRKTEGKTSGTAAAGQSGTGVAIAAVPALADYLADDSTITVTGATGQKVQLEIVRPRIPGAVVAHILRSSQARSVDIGQTMGTDLKIGLTALSSLALGSAGNSGAPGSVPLTQSPYYKLLVKGEAARAKPGRADDFAWPRQLQTAARQPGS